MGYNLLTNGDFSTNTTGWSATTAGATLSRVTSSPSPQSGSGCLKVVKTSVSGTGFISSTPIALDIENINPANPNLYYTFSGYLQVYDVGQATTINVYIRWYSDAGTTLVGSTVRIVNNLYAGRGWVPFSISDVAPSNATYANVEISELGSPANGSLPTASTIFYADNLSFYEMTQAQKTSIVNKSIAAKPVNIDNIQYTGPKLKSDISLGSLVLNTMDINNVIWICSNIEGWWDTADLELPDIPRGLDDGSFDSYGRWTTRTIQLDGSILPQSPEIGATAREELFRQINIITAGAWFIVDESPEISKASWVHLSAKPTITVANARGRTNFQVPLKANDPIKYQWNWNDPMGYFYSDATGNVTTPTTIANNGTALVSNIGNTRVGSIITLTNTDTGLATVPPGTAITITSSNANGGTITQNIVLAEKLVAGDVLKIDTLQRIVTINGATTKTQPSGDIYSARSYLNVDIDWTKFYPGNNTVTLTNAGSVASLRVAHRPGWIG